LPAGRFRREVLVPMLLAQHPEVVLGMLIEALGLNRISPCSRIPCHRDVGLIFAARMAPIRRGWPCLAAPWRAGGERGALRGCFSLNDPVRDLWSKTVSDFGGRNSGMVRDVILP